MVSSQGLLSQGVFICALVGIGFVPGSVHGQIVIPPEDRPSVEQELDRLDRQREQGLDKARRERLQARDAKLDLEADPGADIDGEDAVCFEIDRTEISGTDQVGEPEGYDALNGSCAGANDVRRLLRDLNKYYEARGLITTRVYAPKQSLKDRKLGLAVVPGTLAGFDYADEREPDQRLDAAFPILKGEVINLRDLEQGLENFNAPSSQSGKFKLFPGEEDGQTIVRVEAQRKKRLWGEASVDNSGFDTTGIVKGRLRLGLDQLLGFNDTLSFTTSSNLTGHSEDRESRSYSLSYTVPAGNWVLDISANYSEYDFPVAGINQSYAVDGHSYGGSFELGRKIYRDKFSKVSAFGGLGFERGYNYITSYATTNTPETRTELFTQRRELTVADAGFSGRHYMGDGKLTWRVGGKAGLPWFGADYPEGRGIDPYFRLVYGNANFETPVMETPTTFTLAVSGQWSDDDLPGSKQIGMGGRSDVRGFHGDSLYGNRGAYVRSELKRDLLEEGVSKLGAYVGFDGGVVDIPPERSFSRNTLFGAVVGIRYEIDKRITLEAAYARAVAQPAEFDKRDHAYLSARIVF